MKKNWINVECFYLFSFTKIKEDYIKEFSKRITDISLMECERYNQVLAQQVAGGASDLLQQDWTEDQQSVKELLN